jgi:hypothetical protein
MKKIGVIGIILASALLLAAPAQAHGTGSAYAQVNKSVSGISGYGAYASSEFHSQVKVTVSFYRRPGSATTWTLLSQVSKFSTLESVDAYTDQVAFDCAKDYRTVASGYAISSTGNIHNNASDTAIRQNTC